MRICLISREFPPDTGWGGIATFVHDLALGLHEIGHQVEVIALAADEREASVVYEGITVHRVAWTGLLAERQRLLTAMPYSHNILKQITSLWRKFLAIHTEWPFDVVEAPEMFAEGLFVATSRVAPLVVRLYTPHFKFIDERLHNITEAFDHQFIALLERLTMLTADVVTSPSEDLADYICRDMNYPRQNIPIVRDPVNTGKFGPDGPRALNADGNLTVLFAGRLEARKGVYYLMEAIPKVVSVFPRVRFVLIGRDTNTAARRKSVLAELRRMLRKSGCTDKVTFIPGVPNSEMPSYYRSADICVLPSLYDNAPFTCIEALSTGKPVIGTTAGGMKEYIVHGQSGLVVPPADANALAQALLELLTDDEKRRRMGEFAREHVVANFDRKEIARQSAALYKLARANFASTKDFALYRHEPAGLLSAAEELIGSYDKMLYDLLYAHSWRFRLSHWLSMLRDRPRLTMARAAARAAGYICRLAGFKAPPAGLARLEMAIEARQHSDAGQAGSGTPAR
ncbi:MAG TPA: glycosyltransferase family 4 protein [Candidatus Obscuribacterales bacterium]